MKMQLWADPTKTKLEWRFPAATDRANARGLSLAKSISDVDGRAFPVDRDFVSRLSTLFFCPVLFSAELNPGTART